MDLTLLPGVPTFEQLYLIGKILGETLSLKFVLYKYLTEWNLNGKVDMVDIGNGFNLLNFLILWIGILFFMVNPGSLGQIFCLQVWRKNFDLVKEKIQFVPL